MRLAAGLGLTVILAACSIFPATLTQISAERNLSSIIPAGAGSSYDLYAVTSGTTRLVILASDNSSIDPVLIVMDESLAVLHTFTAADIYALTGTSFSTGRVMVSTTGEIFVGSHSFTAAQLADGSGAISLSVNLYDYGFSSTYGSFNYMNCRTNNTDYFTTERYTPGWAGTTISALISSDTTASYYLQGIWNIDDTAGSGIVLMALSASYSNTSTFVRVNLDDFYNGALSAPLLSAYPSYTVESLESDTISFAGDCIVAYNHSDNSLTRYSLTDLSKIDSVGEGQDKGAVRWSFSVDGGYGVKFNQDSRIVSKVEKWW